MNESKEKNEKEISKRATSADSNISRNEMHTKPTTKRTCRTVSFIAFCSKNRSDSVEPHSGSSNAKRCVILFAVVDFGAAAAAAGLLC